MTKETESSISKFFYYNNIMIFADISTLASS